MFIHEMTMLLQCVGYFRFISRLIIIIIIIIGADSQFQSAHATLNFDLLSENGESVAYAEGNYFFHV